MIFVTGDCHAEYNRFSNKNFEEQSMMNRDDYVICCGDFGYWDNSKDQLWWRKWLSERPFTILFVDGNHENFDMLDSLEIQEWHGGKVHFISDNIIHLMRGQVYQIGEETVFTFGGARSHDISNGILDRTDPDFKKKAHDLNKRRLFYRVNHESWWEQEMPNEAEFEEGRKNLERVNYKVDFVISHCAPSSMVAYLSWGQYPADTLTTYLEEIKQKLEYKKWFFGHYHNNLAIIDNGILIYEQIIRIS